MEDDATHGGFVAVTGDDSNVKIEGCVFGGEMLGPASGGCGGIVGYARNNLTIKNCLFAPSGYFLGSETIASEPFVRIRYSDRVWPDNNYSTILFFPSEQAGELFEITADSALDMRLRDYTEYKTSKVKVSPAGNITINGGDITARGGGLSAAIGSGGGYGAGGTVTINGGKVTAIGGSGGAGGASGIGTSHRSGKLYPNRTITVNINGGIQGAGIGGGVQGTGGTINISGGTITAKGGSNNDGSGAGIGGGSTGAGGNVTILGGTVTATPGSGSDTQAIGHGSGAEDSGTLTLGNNNVRIKVGTVSGNNVTYVGASQRISTAQGTAAVRAAVCDSHQYEQGACKWCGIDAPTCIVTWKNDDGTVLKTDTVKISVVPTYTGATPTKAKTAQYTYTFDGWTPAVAAVTGNTTYTAKFKATTNRYTVTWKNEDGTVLKTEKVAYGATPKYEGEPPAKAATAQYTYTFDGWTPAIKAVTGDATYTAKYKSTVNQYTMPDRLFLLIRQRKLFPKREEPRGKGR